MLTSSFFIFLYPFGGPTTLRLHEHIIVPAQGCAEISTFLHNRARLYTVVQKVYRLSDRGFVQPVSIRCAVGNTAQSAAVSLVVYGSAAVRVWQCSCVRQCSWQCAAVCLVVCGSARGCVAVQLCAAVRAAVWAAVCGSAPGSMRAVCIPTTCLRSGLGMIRSVS